MGYSRTFCRAYLIPRTKWHRCLQENQTLYTICSDLDKHATFRRHFPDFSRHYLLSIQSLLDESFFSASLWLSDDCLSVRTFSSHVSRLPTTIAYAFEMLSLFRMTANWHFSGLLIRGPLSEDQPQRSAAAFSAWLKSSRNF